MRLTPAKKRVLLALRKGLPAHHGLSGRSAFGGHVWTIHALRRAGLINRDELLTEEGRAVAERVALREAGRHADLPGQMLLFEKAKRRRKGARAP